MLAVAKGWQIGFQERFEFTSFMGCRDLEKSERIKDSEKRIDMEPPKGILASLWTFICLLPVFTGLLLLGIIKGIIFCPLISLIMTIANSAIILSLWPLHVFWTYHCIVRANHVGWGLKFLLCVCVLPVILLLWPEFGILGSIVGGAAYGFLAPIFATFDVVGEGKTNEVFHCMYDGTWSTIEGCFVVIGDFRDVCFHSYFSAMEELEQKGTPDGRYYDIRLLNLPGAFIAGILGVMVDIPVISLVALCKCPFMLFKGWIRLCHDLIDRKGLFLETICVPFSGLAIFLWPLAVVGAVVSAIVSSSFLGAYAGVVVYQESSFWLGLCYILASISIFDEYSNDVLDMANGSCFPRPIYRKKDMQPAATSQSSISRPTSVKSFPSHTDSFRSLMIELKPLELLDRLFKECKRQGEIMISKGLITLEDFEDGRSSKGSRVISIGLPAYCILQTIFRSAKGNSVGLLLGDNVTEITSTNRPRDAFFDWFLKPLLIIKEQIKAENLSEEEEDYLSKLVLLSDDPIRLKNSNIGSPPESKCRCAQLEALARRLRGITRSISRYPTFRRRFSSLVDAVSEDLSKKDGTIKPSRRNFSRSRSAIGRFLSQISFKSKTGNDEIDQELKVVERDVEVK